MAISRLRVVWTRALQDHILGAGIPFPPASLESLEMPALEQTILHARRLADFWVRPPSLGEPVTAARFSASSGTGVTDVRFLPAHPGRILTVTRGIWPLITCWDIGGAPKGGTLGASVGSSTATRPRKVAEWFRKGALFTGIAVNSDPTREACLAISLNFSGYVCQFRFLVVSVSRGV